MGRISTRAAECNYKEHNRRLKEQYVYGISNEEMTQEIIKLLMAWKNTQEVDSKQVQMWAQRVEVESAEKSVRSHEKHERLDLMQKGRQTKIANRQQPKEQKWACRVENCKYPGTAHMQRQCQAFGKTCSMCGKQNYFRAVCQTLRGQTQTGPTAQQPRSMHEIHKEEGSPLTKLSWEKQKLCLSKHEILNSQQHKISNIY